MVCKTSIIQVHRVGLVDFVLNLVEVSAKVDRFIKARNRCIIVLPFKVSHAETVIERRAVCIFSKCLLQHISRLFEVAKAAVGSTKVKQTVILALFVSTLIFKLIPRGFEVNHS